MSRNGKGHENILHFLGKDVHVPDLETQKQLCGVLYPLMVVPYSLRRGI
jgi:hypothetical protein